MDNLNKRLTATDIDAGKTPSGLDIKVIVINDKKNINNQLALYPDGHAAYFRRGKEVSTGDKAYKDMGINTNTESFKTFESNIRDNFKADYVNEHFINEPDITAHKTIKEGMTREEWDIEKSNFEKSLVNDYNLNEKQAASIALHTADINEWKQDIENHTKEYDVTRSQAIEGLATLTEDYENEESLNIDYDYGVPVEEIPPATSEFKEQTFRRFNDNDLRHIEINANSYVKYAGGDEKDIKREIIGDLNKKIDERGLGGDKIITKDEYEQKKLVEAREAESTVKAQPGRVYTGKIISVGEDTTLQVTKNGNFVIHETENLPGIKDHDSSAAMQIKYDSSGKGDITAKSNDLAIGKEKAADKSLSKKSMEIPF